MAGINHFAPERSAHRIASPPAVEGSCTPRYSINSALIRAALLSWLLALLPGANCLFAGEKGLVTGIVDAAPQAPIAGAKVTLAAADERPAIRRRRPRRALLVSRGGTRHLHPFRRSCGISGGHADRRAGPGRNLHYREHASLPGCFGGSSSGGPHPAAARLLRRHSLEGQWGENHHRCSRILLASAESATIAE